MVLANCLIKYHANSYSSVVVTIGTARENLASRLVHVAETKLNRTELVKGKLSPNLTPVFWFISTGIVIKRLLCIEITRVSILRCEVILKSGAEIRKVNCIFLNVSKYNRRFCD